MIKNIVIINDFDYVQGGASKVAIQTANMLVESDNNINVYFFSAVHSNDSILDKRVIRVCTNQLESLNYRNKIHGFVNGIYNFKAKKQLKELLNTLDRNQTVIHIHGWTKALSSSIFSIIFKLKFKMVLTMHDFFTACPNGGYFNYKTNSICYLKPMSWKCIKCNCDSRNYFFKLYRILRHFVQNKIVKLNNKLTDVISISNLSENILKNTLKPSVNIHRIYNPISLNDGLKKVDYTKNDYYLYVGRVSKEKGVDLFCKAISDLNLRGIVVGDGSELERLKKNYPDIEYMGWKKSDEVSNYMRSAKALIFTSIWYETMGLTVLEAQSIGVPCIVSDNTAATEFTLNQDLVFKQGDCTSLKEKILLVDQGNIKKINSIEYKTMYDKFQNKKYVYSLKECYKRVSDYDK